MMTSSRPVHHVALCTTDVELALRFWQDGMGLTQLFDHSFSGSWRQLFGAETDELRSIFLGDGDAGLVELVMMAGSGAALPPGAPRAGLFLVSFERDVDEQLARLAELGFEAEVRRIEQPAGAGKVVPMAVIRAPDGVLVELIGPAR
jgi:catechol 2,3-dioxygenase-like lactoylglutathione lyase family enzyme